MSLEARMDKIERRLDATTKIVQTGMKLLVKMQKEHLEFKKETRYAINALIASQERAEIRMAKAEARQDRLDARLDKFIASMGRNGNGHGSNGHSKN